MRGLVDVIKENKYKILDLAEEVAREVLESKNTINRGWYNIYIYANGEIDWALEARGGSYKEYKNKNNNYNDSIKVFSIKSYLDIKDIEDLLDKCKIELDLIIADLQQ